MATVNAIALLIMKEFGSYVSNSAHVTKVEAFVNDAYKDLYREFEWPWRYSSETVSLVASTQEYSLSTSAGEIYAARLAGTTDRELVYIDPQTLQSSDIEVVGFPTNYFQSGYDSTTGKLKVKIWPVPDASYTAEFWTFLRSADLASGNTIPIPEEFIPILKHKVRAIYALDDKDEPTADRWMNLYRFEVDKAISKLGHPAGKRGDFNYSDIPETASKRFGGRLPGNYPGWW